MYNGLGGIRFRNSADNGVGCRGDAQCKVVWGEGMPYFLQHLSMVLMTLVNHSDSRFSGSSALSAKQASGLLW